MSNPKEKKVVAEKIEDIVTEAMAEINPEDIYKKSSRSGELCIPCSFISLGGEILTPQEAVTEGLCTQDFVDKLKIK